MYSLYSARIVNCLRFSDSKVKAIADLNDVSNEFNDDEHLTTDELKYLQALSLTIMQALNNTPDFVLNNVFEFNA